MTEHVERFTGRVADYEKYRLRYSAAVLDVLKERCGLTTASVVADVGAGTGMLAELFLENGNRVIAIEPNAEMRAACERLRERYSGLSVIAAAAEATTLAAASIDFVSVGRAWHWFDRKRAVVEFRRILRPGGWLVLVTNRRSKEGSAEAKEYEEILMEFGTDYRELQSEYRVYDDMPRVFAEGAVVRETIRGEQMLTLEEFLGQTQSSSVAPMPGDAKYAGMQQALRDFFQRFQRDGVLRMGTVCSVMACQVD
jgi:ubiquinone/menaquinone biosynthesis C-methylase UbiE